MLRYIPLVLTLPCQMRKETLMNTPITLAIEQLPHSDLGKIASWLADGSVGANLTFSISQEDSDFETARNVHIAIKNPTVITADQLKSLMAATFTSKIIFKN